jgi:predicted RNA-binding Zn-ribbon protein involved in translation (DUF1610 family)
MKYKTLLRLLKMIYSQITNTQSSPTGLGEAHNTPSTQIGGIITSQGRNKLSKMNSQPIDRSKLITMKCPICQSKLVPAQMIVMSWINYDCPKCGHVAPKQLQDVYEGYDDSMADFST